MTPQPSQQPMSRREFLRRVTTFGVLTGVSGALAACRPVGVSLPREPSTQESEPRVESASDPLPGTLTQPGDDSEIAHVAFVQTRDRAQGVRQAIDLLGPLALANQRILLKPNFNSPDPAPGSTHPDVLRALVQQLWALDAAQITIADRSGMGDSRRVMEQLGVFNMAQELDVETIVLDELDADAWSMVDAPNSHWQQGFPMANCCLETDAVVQACCLKTHRYGGHFTMSLKNSVGLVAKTRPGDSHNYMTELHSSPHQRRLIAEINAAYAPALLVMDGVDAFVRGGPAKGELVEANVVLASTDRIAMDAVGVALLRHFGTTREVSQGPIFAQEQIARAVELGLGVDHPDKIQLLTADADSARYAAQIQEILVRG